MKISTKGRYALRLMADLARAPQDSLTPIKDIAERQDISEKYLEQIVRSLVRAKLVVSTRGAQGGYALADAPDKITVGMVLRATEGTLEPVGCVSSDCFCDKHDNCDTIYVWRQITEAINGVVDSITLADLISRTPECAERFKIEL